MTREIMMKRTTFFYFLNNTNRPQLNPSMAQGMAAGRRSGGVAVVTPSRKRYNPLHNAQAHYKVQSSSEKRTAAPSMSVPSYPSLDTDRTHTTKSNPQRRGEEEENKLGRSLRRLPSTVSRRSGLPADPSCIFRGPCRRCSGDCNSERLFNHRPCRFLPPRAGGERPWVPPCRPIPSP
jgi:hypothetical protein